MTSELKTLINLSCVLDLDNYGTSLDRWLENYARHEPSLQRAKYFDKYIRIVKPLVHRYHHIVKTIDPKTHGFFSKTLNQSEVKVLCEVYQELRAFEIMASEEVEVVQAKKEDTPSYCFVEEEGFSKNYAKAPITNIFKIPLGEDPKNDEFPYWHSYLPMEEEVILQSTVIHGKGLATKQLGFPTANLQVSEKVEQMIRAQPNAIFLVEIELAGLGKYLGTCSLGTNPHYEDSKFTRLIEVYIYHSFEKTFYGTEASLKLLALTRFEGKFQTFDCFLNAMQNDICYGTILAKKLGLNLP